MTVLSANQEAIHGVAAGPRRVARTLRFSEKCLLAFFVYTSAACWFFPITLSQRLTILALNALASGVLAGLSRADSGSKSIFIPLRDWLPCVLIVLAYRESGMFIQPDVTHRIDVTFEAWDRELMMTGWFRALVTLGSPWLGRIMELAYLLVYPFVPAGFVAVYFSKRGAVERNVIFDRYWSAVLIAVLASYTLFPYFPLTPPRVLFHDFPGGTADTTLRGLNGWVLGRYSVQACIFPSGHVAGAVATALAVRAERPRWGVAFLLAAILISVSTFYGRYHYCADALAGALAGVAAFFAVRFRR